MRSARLVAPSVRLMEIEPARCADYAPGSHLNVGVTIGGRADTRSYSLIGAAPHAGAYRIAVKKQPESRGGSAYMWGLREGSRITISNPQNLFVLRFTAPEYLLVAGGIGITPLIAMTEALDRPGLPFRLLYAARTRAELAFVEDLQSRLGTRLEVFVSDESARLDLAAQIARLHPESELYICGPLRMIDHARAIWTGAMRPAQSLRFETFGSSGLFAPQSFRVHVTDRGVEVVVGEHETMLDALRNAGVEILADCLRGECGLCKVDVITADAALDHRDVFLSTHEKARNNTLCACVSRAVGGSITIDTGFRR